MKKHVIFLPIMLGLLLASCGESGSASTIPGSLPYTPGTNQGAGENHQDSETSESECSCSDEEEESYDDFNFPPGVKKPIIYFYPEEEMDLSVTFVNEELLTTTYPKYSGGWNIHLKEDGTLTVPGSNREYYGLYYESIPNYECTFDEGFYITGEDAASFLEEKMDYMGFTNRETDEFIMYWLPILERNERSLVYFEQTEERNEESPLVFSTEPNTLIRVVMHIKKVDEPTNIQEQQLTHQERTGFTVTEWGGEEH